MTPVILLADDHIMISKGLRKLFEIDFGYRNISSVTSCSGVLKLLKKRVFSHLVIDIGLSDGSALEILPVIRKMYPQVQIMVYSARRAVVYQRGLQKLDIHSYLCKETEELETIRRFRIFLNNVEDNAPRDMVGESPFSTLTERQLQVMHHLLDGKSGTQIAETLNVTTSTVSTLKGQLLERTGAKNIVELMALANLHSLLEVI